MKLATFALFCSPFAVDLCCLPFLSPGEPGNVTFEVFNSCVGKSIGVEEV